MRKIALSLVLATLVAAPVAAHAAPKCTTEPKTP